MTAIATAPPQLAAPAAMVPDPGITPDDLLALDGEGLFELVDGRLVEKRMGADATLIVTEVVFHLRTHVGPGRAGYVMPEQTFQCFPDDPGRVRRPDVAYVAAGRMPDPRPPGHLPIRPDLAVEVVSPSDNAYDLEQKLDDYRSAQIPLVWVLFPHVRLVRVHAPGQPNVERRPGDTLDGGPVLPGFAVAVADLFPPAAADA